MCTDRTRRAVVCLDGAGRARLFDLDAEAASTTETAPDHYSSWKKLSSSLEYAAAAAFQPPVIAYDRWTESSIQEGSPRRHQSRALRSNHGHELPHHLVEAYGGTDGQLVRQRRRVLEYVVAVDLVPHQQNQGVATGNLPGNKTVQLPLTTVC